MVVALFVYVIPTCTRLCTSTRLFRRVLSSFGFGASLAQFFNSFISLVFSVLPKYLFPVCRDRNNSWIVPFFIDSSDIPACTEIYVAYWSTYTRTHPISSSSPRLLSLSQLWYGLNASCVILKFVLPSTMAWILWPILPFCVINAHAAVTASPHWRTLFHIHTCRVFHFYASDSTRNFPLVFIPFISGAPSSVASFPFILVIRLVKIIARQWIMF